MPYLVEADTQRPSAGEQLRHMLETPGIVQMPGAHNGLAALQAKAAGLRHSISRAPL